MVYGCRAEWSPGGGLSWPGPVVYLWLWNRPRRPLWRSTLRRSSGQLIGITIAVLLLLVIVSALALTMHGVSYLHTEVVAVPTNTPPARPPPPPQLERMSAPRAVLILDVSGSMGLGKDASDPEHLQTEAVLQFQRIFTALSKETLEEDEVAGTAVILFAAEPRAIRWPGTADPFLPATEANLPLFRRVMEDHLGVVGKREPRRGKRTDYVRALDALADVLEKVDQRSGPPAIVFMTDGLPDPTPPAEGEPPTDAEIDAAIRQRVTALLARQYAVPGGQRALPAVWAPVLLNRSADESTRKGLRQRVRATLAASSASARAWSLRDPLLECETPGGLVRDFVDVLSSWFGLLPVPVQDGGFVVARDTRAFAVLAVAPKDVRGVTISGPCGDKALVGHRRHWGGVIAGESCTGRWRVAAGQQGSVKDIEVRARPRHEWVLAAPERHVVVQGGAAPLAELHLCRIGGRRCETQGVFPDLPATLSGTFSIAGKARPLTFELQRSADEQGGVGPRYRTSLPVAAGDTGEARVVADLRGMRAAGMVVRTERLERTLRLEPGVALEVVGPDGQTTAAVDVRDLPLLPSWLPSSWVHWLDGRLP